MNYPIYATAEVYSAFSGVDQFSSQGQDSLPADFPRVEVVAEMVNWRCYGPLAWGHLQDDTGSLQICLRRDKFGPCPDFRFAGEGSIYRVRGAVYRTDFNGGSGLLTIMVESIVKEAL